MAQVRKARDCESAWEARCGRFNVSSACTTLPGARISQARASALVRE